MLELEPPEGALLELDPDDPPRGSLLFAPAPLFPPELEPDEPPLGGLTKVGGVGTVAPPLILLTF